MFEDICIVDGCERKRDKKQNRKICQMHRVRFGRYRSYELPEKELLPDGIVKICMMHGELSEDKVYRSKNYKYPQCLKCKKISNNKFKEKNPNRDSNSLRAHYYVRNSTVKISKDDYQNLLTKQNDVCAICKKSEYIINGKVNLKPKRLSIDHCHSTNKIRGLLCHRCNVSLGSFNDSIETLQSAIDYLKSHL